MEGISIFSYLGDVSSKSLKAKNLVAIGSNLGILSNPYLLPTFTFNGKLKVSTGYSLLKLVGEKWRDLSPEDKYPYEEQSASAKERYNDELVEYKQTGQYASYTQYLMEFRARRSDSYESTLLIHYIEVFDGIFLI